MCEREVWVEDYCTLVQLLSAFNVLPQGTGSVAVFLPLQVEAVGLSVLGRS